MTTSYPCLHRAPRTGYCRRLHLRSAEVRCAGCTVAAPRRRAYRPRVTPRLTMAAARDLELPITGQPGAWRIGDWPQTYLTQARALRALTDWIDRESRA